MTMTTDAVTTNILPQGQHTNGKKKEAGLRTRTLSVPTGQTHTGETIITNRYYHNLPHTIRPQVQPAVWDISAEHSGP